MNAILIDPKLNTIDLIHLNNFDLEELKQVVDCEMLELAISFEDIQVDLYCDEEGWLRNREIYGFELDGVLIPSKAVVVGFNEDGRQIPLTINKLTCMLALLIRNVVWRGELNEQDIPPIQVFTLEDLND